MRNLFLAILLIISYYSFGIRNGANSGVDGRYFIQIFENGNPVSSSNVLDYEFYAVLIGKADTMDMNFYQNRIIPFAPPPASGNLVIDMNLQGFQNSIDQNRDQIKVVLVKKSNPLYKGELLLQPPLVVAGNSMMAYIGWGNGINIIDEISSLAIMVDGISLCSGEKEKEIKARISGTIDYSILWPDGITPKAGEKSVGIVDADAFSEGVNELTLQVKSGARVATVDFIVTVQPAPGKPQIDIESNPVSDVSSLSFKVVDESFRQGCKYQWFVNNRLQENGSARFKYGGLKEGDIVMCKAKDGQCDSDSESNKLTVNRSMLSGQSDEACIVPNLITPNGDGLNDTWQIDWLVSWPDYLLTIYNGQGKIVYRTNHYKNDWEGRIGGKLSYGVYTYTIDLHNGTVLQSWLYVRSNKR